MAGAATQPIPNGLPYGVGVQFPTQVLSADGAITIPCGHVFITKGSGAAVTLAAPQADGLRLSISSTTAFAHTLDLATSGVNAGSADVGTFGGAAFDYVVLVSVGAHWYVESKLNVTFA
jgi:hypothetical protein